MMKDKELIDLIEAHLVRTGLSPTRFGEHSVKDPNLVFEVREGRWLRGPTRKRVIDFIKSQSQAPSEAA